MCDCQNVEVGSHANSIAVDAPPCLAQYSANRVRAGLSPQIAVDKCILPELKSLWDLGIKTYGSCCGHNVYPSEIWVAPEHIQQMIDLGYRQSHDASHPEQFYGRT